ncbi:MAG TPA: hypothetical protein VEK57_18605 [Thermoanaerobaculia bacterium]|nr:hypothetical protein [Thermoanaerobaculia bacterium]
MISREYTRLAVAIVATILLLVALVRHFHWLGGPYFELPKTVQDHVWPVPFASRDAILLSKRAAELLPRGATVTAFQPSTAPNIDVTHFLSAAGMMPHHRVLPPILDGKTGELPRYVLSVREELSHPSYALHSSWPEGHIYEVRR